MASEQASKRRKIGHPERTLHSLHRDISPPPSKQRPSLKAEDESKLDPESFQVNRKEPVTEPGLLRSPFRLTTIQDLDEVSNRDTISLHDILGDPLLKEVWLFDYLFDLDFVMDSLDPDVQALVQIKIIHGSWKQEDGQRIRLEEDAKKYNNVELICAYMPEPFGTHHTKMMVLFRHDDFAQVVIHTANMISFDWANMTQGAWLSPLLPLTELSPEPLERPSAQLSPRSPGASQQNRWETLAQHAIGSGERFKVDLLRYLREYKRKTAPLVGQLSLYDFSAVRAAFLGHAPTKATVDDADSSRFTSYGWPGLEQILKAIEVDAMGPAVVQISSVATLTEAWTNRFFDRLAPEAKGKVKIIFPTVEEIRCSLNGWMSGGSIHMKARSAAQKKQVDQLRRFFHGWSSDSASSPIDGSALRSLAAPHIKTYIRFNDAACSSIAWALLTSANLSTQAWGALPDAEGRVRICSYEVGVVVWPELLGAEEMVPIFGKDSMKDVEEKIPDDKKVGVVRVPLRMPYDLPLRKYSMTDQPWIKEETHTIPDANGNTWA